MAARIMVTGASGFVGSAVVRELLRRGREVNALVNRRPAADDARVRSVPGGLFDDHALREACAGCEAVVHLVGIIREAPRQGITFQRMHEEATRRVVEAAAAAGARRFVHMSALGTRPDAASVYHRTKWAAEEHVRSSGLEWTILRPSLIHGPGGEFMTMVAKWSRGAAPPYLFMPYFGAGLLGTRGAGKIQPVDVEDVARAFADALEKPGTVGKVYELGGADTLTWPQFHRIASSYIAGRPGRTAAIPAWWALLLATVLPGWMLPFNRDQVVMSREDNTCDLAGFREDFGWTPAGFEESLQRYAAEL